MISLPPSGQILYFRKFRKQYRISLSALAKAAGLSPQRICQMELNGIPSPSGQNVLRNALETILIHRYREAQQALDALEQENGKLFTLAEEGET